MDNIRIIYRILKMLEVSMDNEEFDERCISPETLHIYGTTAVTHFTYAIDGRVN